MVSLESVIQEVPDFEFEYDNNLHVYKKKVCGWINRYYYRPATKCHDIHMHVCPDCQHEYGWDYETGEDPEEWNFCPNCGNRRKEEKNV